MTPAEIEQATLFGQLWERLALAAYLGHKPASEALGEASASRARELAADLSFDLSAKGSGPIYPAPGILPYAGRRGCVLAGLAAAELGRERLKTAGLVAPLAALDAATRWCESPCWELRKASQEACDGALAAAKSLPTPQTAYQLLGDLWDEALSRARHVDRPLAESEIASEVGAEEAAQLFHFTLAAALCARCASLPVLLEAHPTPDPETLLRLIRGHAAAVLGSERVDLEIRRRLLPHALGERDTPSLVEAGTALAKHASRVAAQRSPLSGPGWAEWEELRSAVLLGWLGEEEHAWCSEEYRLYFSRTVPRWLLKATLALSFLLSFGLLWIAVLLLGKPFGQFLPKAGLALSWLVATGGLTLFFVLAFGSLLGWRYSQVWLNPARRTIEVAESGYHDSPKYAYALPRVYELEAVVGWREFAGGVAIDLRCAWWKRFLCPVYVPTDSPEERELAKRFLRQEGVEELLREPTGASPGFRDLLRFPMM